jgi:hypothetical protein
MFRPSHLWFIFGMTSSLLGPRISMNPAATVQTRGSVLVVSGSSVLTPPFEHLAQCLRRRPTRYMQFSLCKLMVGGGGCWPMRVAWQTSANVRSDTVCHVVSTASSVAVWSGICAPGKDNSAFWFTAKLNAVLDRTFVREVLQWLTPKENASPCRGHDLNSYRVRVWTDSAGSGKVLMAVCCEHDNEP